MGHLSEQMKSVLSVEVPSVNMDEVLTVIGRVDGSDREQLLGVCEEAFRHNWNLRGPMDRIAYARVLVALLPASLPVVRDWLVRRGSVVDYEVHFTLFCYLDWCQELPESSSVGPAVLDLVSDYLETVPADTARAAWMAGDLLGDHWSASETWPMLLDLTQRARYVAGRKAALSGLETVVRKGITPAQAREAASVLRRVSLSDRSPAVRGMAARVMELATA